MSDYEYEAKHYFNLQYPSASSTKNKFSCSVFEVRHDRSNIVIINVILAQVNHFRYLGNMVSTTTKIDINYKLNSFINISDIINNIFKPENLNKSRLRLLKY